MSTVPLLPGTLLLVIGSGALMRGEGAPWPAITAGLLLLILAVLMDIRSELERR